MWRKSAEICKGEINRESHLYQRSETWLMGYIFYIWKSFSLSILAAVFEWFNNSLNMINRKV